MALAFNAWMVSAQDEIIYNEELVPEYKLPDPLVTFKGKHITDVQQWESVGRPELMEFFTNEMYGKIPGKLGIASYEMIEQGASNIYKNTVRQQVRITVKKDAHELSCTLLLFLPGDVVKAPVFLGCNFYGNHGAVLDPQVIISTAWTKNNATYHISNNTFTETSRGSRADRWAVQKIIDSGMGLATFYYGEIDPDKNDFTDGIHPFFYKKDQQAPAAQEWGSISAWAWGMSRALDYLTKNERVDASKVIAFGHSRLGKTALWAGANDKRFAAVISNNSGCGGAALSKRTFGETLAVMNKSFPHWLCSSFKQYSNKESLLPVDQHELIALIAPRPVYIASAVEDKWADPRGEFLSAYHAGPVYKLYGKTGIPDTTMPGLHQPIHNTVAYHIREGIHYVTDYDWDQYIKWAKTMLVIQ